MQAMEPSTKEHILKELETQITFLLNRLETGLEQSKLASLPVPASASLADSACALLDVTEPTLSAEQAAAELCLTVPLSIVPTDTLRSFTSNTVAHAVEGTESQASQSLADKNIISSADVITPLTILALSLNGGQPLEPAHYAVLDAALGKLSAQAKADSMSALDEARAQKAFRVVSTRVDAQGKNVWSASG